MASEPEKTSEPDNEIVNFEVSIHEKINNTYINCTRYINCASENYNEIII